MGPEIKRKIIKRIFLLFPLAIVVLGILFFVPAGSLKFWQAWVFCGVIIFPMLFVSIYFLKKAPEFLERRLMYREKEKEQQLIIKFGSIFYFLLFLLPGLDFRFGWSQVPFWLVIASEAGILFGYFFVFLAFKENAYAGRTVEIFEGQKVIESGPYAKVRHPMYVGVLLMFLFIPTALGSFWALLAFIPVAALIIYRIFNEEKVLSRDLAGYKEYMGKVKFRLMPGIW